MPGPARIHPLAPLRSAALWAPAATIPLVIKVTVAPHAMTDLPSRSCARRMIGTLAVLALVAQSACTSEPRPSPATRDTAAANAGAGVDSLNARLSKAYRDRDPVAYGRLFTDSAVFEWPAFNTVRGRAGLEAMARGNWAALRDMDLELDVAHRRIAPDHVTEFGAFRQSYSDSSGRNVEYGRYVAVLVPVGNEWRMDRFFGFSDSTAKAGTTPGASR